MKKGKIIKKTIGAIFLLGLLVFFIHLVSMLFYGNENIELKEISFKSAAVRPELDGFSILFISDTHQIPGEDLQALVEEINAGYEVDLVALGGDYPAWEAAHRTMAILSGLENTAGIVGIEGNHDGVENIFPAMEKYGIRPLSNSGIRLGNGLFVGGVEDLWNGVPDTALATAGAQANDFTVLLSHNPDVSMIEETVGIDMILSGHMHGGQVSFFGLWSPAIAKGNISRYGHRFLSGLCYNDEGTPVYVSRGAGRVAESDGFVYPRIFARPDVLIITLEQEDEE